ncbi:hypothetical protein Ocin01_18989 [Orchesella cincta]|uniref:Uncharacterized protein n=1 Tax=Orchesella cincta TaxID=48709 RepID=A0A1D2M3Y7_ORCCI|nr:hypothetical protein Ocin01_18989 [Orchesella cincta]
MGLQGSGECDRGKPQNFMDAEPLEKLVGKEISPNGDKLAVYSVHEKDCRELESEWANTMGNGCKTVTLPPLNGGISLMSTM